MNSDLKIGIALGSGSARGWSHIGVLKALHELGIVPSIVCGTSIGALVGASYVSNRMDNLEKWVLSLTKLKTAKFIEINTSLNGFVNTTRFHAFLNKYVAADDAKIEAIDKKYAAVSTDLGTGKEIWFTCGPIVEAVWASISLPGLFPAIKNDNRWLVDGGLVNPVPVSVCRALGADLVIAVNLNSDVVGKHFNRSKKNTNTNGIAHRLSDLVKEYTGTLFLPADGKDKPPSLLDAIAGSIDIIQDRITRSRMVGDPPDILLSPKLSHIGLLEFYRASESIDEGNACVHRMLPEIRHTL